MRLAVLLGLFVVIWISQTIAADLGGKEPRPHWAPVELPYDFDRNNIRIEKLPDGFRVCSIANSYSSDLWFYVLLDREIGCENLKMGTSDDDKPDFVVIAPYLDTPLVVETLDDYIDYVGKPYCKSPRPASKDGGLGPSTAPVSIASAGTRIMGLNTVACTREDVAYDRYSKAFLAYRPDPAYKNGGRGYTVASYVHIKNKNAADELLEKVTSALKPLN